MLVCMFMSEASNLKGRNLRSETGESPIADICSLTQFVAH